MTGISSASSQSKSFDINYDTNTMIQGRNRTRIRPPRRSVNGDQVDFQSMWNALSNAFDQIHNRSASQLSYEELYRLAYRLVLKKEGGKLYDNVQEYEKTWLEEHVQPKILNLVSTSLASISTGDAASGSFMTAGNRREEGERFLSGMKEEWDGHVLCTNMLSDVLMYMDRVFCAEQKRPSVTQMAMNLWRNCILFSRSSDTSSESPMIIKLLTSVILDQIHMHRDGHVVDPNPILHCVWMLDGLFEGEMNTLEARLYHIHFEQAFLEASRVYYRAEAVALLSGSNAKEYCQRVTKRLQQEQERCGQMLMECTVFKIEKVVEDELIRNKITEVIQMENGVNHMIVNDSFEDLNRIYKLERRVDRKTTEFTKAICQQVEAMGTSINEAATMITQPEAKGAETNTVAVAKSSNVQTSAAIKWVGDVLDLKDKFDHILNRACERDNDVQAAITRSFTAFVNCHDFNRASEYISLFIDDNMKRGIKDKSEAEVDVVLHKAIVLLRYVQDKDMFEGYYKKHLAKRLLLTKSLDMDVEQDMVSRMKIDCGSQFTQKLEAMFKDMQISRELSQGYRHHIAGLGATDTRPVDLGVHVLTSITWPDMTKGGGQGGAAGAAQCKLPPEIEELRRSFQVYYDKKHNGRKLDWFMNLGTADVTARFARKYEINVPTHAMIVLLLFNHHTSITFEEIQAETNIPHGDLTRTLQSLTLAPKTRLLRKEPVSREINASDVFSVNEKFNSPFIKIKVGVIAGGNKVENNAERLETERRLAAMRQQAIEAAIVRIMKQRQVLDHQHLLLETVEQLKSHFKPDLRMIKQRIEGLIEREYIARVGDVTDSKPSAYRYLA